MFKATNKKPFFNAEHVVDFVILMSAFVFLAMVALMLVVVTNFNPKSKEVIAAARFEEHSTPLSKKPQ